MIHHPKLKQGIFMVRRPDGNAVTKLKTQKVSESLASVLDDMLHEEVPDFDHLSKEERDFLRKVASTCELDARLKFKTPAKEEKDKDEDSFEIMIGEVRAGNDSPELLKKLKIRIVKMMNDGSIPKSHAHEILTELAAMGQ
jgi:hypothetical protein